MTIISVNPQDNQMSIVRPEKKCFMQTLREQFHSVKGSMHGAEISHENMTEEGLKSRVSSDNPCACIVTFSIASIFS